MSLNGTTHSMTSAAVEMDKKYEISDYHGEAHSCHC